MYISQLCSYNYVILKTSIVDIANYLFFVISSHLFYIIACQSSSENKLLVLKP